jgi:hypothetical protein
MIALANPCFGQTDANPTQEDWTAFALFSKIIRDSRHILPEEVRYTNGNPLSPKVKQKASRAFDELRKLQPFMHGNWGRFSKSNDYTVQLYEDWQGLSLIWNPLRTQEVSDVLDDLYLKAHACLLNGGKAVGSVSVTVHTKNSGTEVSNWRVLCIAKILQLYAYYSPTVFPRLSSPTTWEIPPGKYIMWAENPDTGQRTAGLEIPIDRNEECDLTLR